MASPLVLRGIAISDFRLLSSERARQCASRRRQRATLHQPVVLLAAAAAGDFKQSSWSCAVVCQPCGLTDNGAPRCSPPDDLVVIE
jgi:hypothetical protein